MEGFEEELMRLIREKSGINVNSSHKSFIVKFAESRINSLGISHGQYIEKIRDEKSELILLIDEAAINETYFFREEKQFEFLKEKVFRAGWKPVIWSAACSTGEEALSLYALSKNCGCDAKIYATDIDENAMSRMKEGCYPPHAFRTEGSSFFPMLSQIGEYHTKFFRTSDQTLAKIRISRFNLVLDDLFPMQEGSVDILFMRNVFIYFDEETRIRVIKKMCRSLKEGGLLFISVNEIAGVNCGPDIPLVKEHWNSIYYFRKTGANEKIKLTEKRREEIRETNDDFPEKTLYKKIRAELDFGNTDNARNILSASSYRTDSAAFILYMKGLIETECENLDEAEKCFTKSSIMNPEFWPAFFQLGMTERKKGKIDDSKKYFSRCKQVLKVYSHDEKNCYDFLMDSNSKNHFLEICDSYCGEEKENQD